MRIIIGLILWPLFIASAIIRATKLAFTLNQYTRCKGCKQTTLKENIIFGYCSIECAAETNDALEDITDEINKDPADWIAVYDDDSDMPMKQFTIFFDEDGIIYLQDFSDTERVLLKTVGYDGYSL